MNIPQIRYLFPLFFSCTLLISVNTKHNQKHEKIIETNMSENILIIADNQPLTAAGIFLLAEKSGIFNKTIEVKKKHCLQPILERNCDNSVEIVLDLDLFDFDNLKECETLLKLFQNVHFLFIGEHFTEEIIHSIAEELSANIILKSSELEELSIALSLTVRGKRYIHSEILELLMNNNMVLTSKSIAINTQLTQTEREIVSLIAQGKTTKEVANIRNLSYHTVVTHRKNIFRKLEINSIYELTKYAMRMGLINLTEYYI